MTTSAFAESFSNNSYNLNKNLLENITFAEKQIFDKTYKKEEISNRLERLEIALFGALQNGSDVLRTLKIKKAVTNIASGGNGLQYITQNQLNSLGNNSANSGFWSFRTPYTTPNYNRNLHNRNYHRPNTNCCHSHRFHPPKHKTHRYDHNNTPIINGSFSHNYSLGTGIKILND